MLFFGRRGDRNRRERGGNIATLPIMDAGGSCREPFYALTGSQLAGYNAQSRVKSGSIVVGQLTARGQTSAIATASFENISGFVFGDSAATGLVSVGGCTTLQLSSSAVGNAVTQNETALAPGPLSLQGPAGNYPVPAIGFGVYQTMLPGAAVPPGGAFVLTGNGGADVGQFTATLNIPSPPLSWSNQNAAAAVNRSQGLPVTWTGRRSGNLCFYHRNRFQRRRIRQLLLLRAAKRTAIYRAVICFNGPAGGQRKYDGRES
jgi:hypothetical protein